jgi:hypothetical protein
VGLVVVSFGGIGKVMDYVSYTGFLAVFESTGCAYCYAPKFAGILANSLLAFLFCSFSIFLFVFGCLNSVNRLKF